MTATIRHVDLELAAWAETGAPQARLGFHAEITADSPVGYWRLGEGSGSTATNEGSTVINGTYGGSYSHQATNVAVYENTGSVDFNASNARATMASTGYGFGARLPFTVVAAVRREDAAVGGHLIWNRSSTDGWLLRVQASTFYAYFARRTSSANTTVVSTAAIRYAENDLVAGVYDGTNLYVWLNGTKYGPTSDTRSISASSDPLTIANNNANTLSFEGNMSHAAIFDSALADARLTRYWDAFAAGL